MSLKSAWVAHQVLESLGYRVGPCLREQEQSKTLKIHGENTKKEKGKNIVIFSSNTNKIPNFLKRLVKKENKILMRKRGEGLIRIPQDMA